MWRRMHRKEFYEYHGGLTSANTDESHPFIGITGGSSMMNGQMRTNISAARQFNESPSFQRLNTTTTTTNQTSIHNMNTNSLSRNRYCSTTSRQQAHNNPNNNNNPSNNNYQSLISANYNHSRVNEYVMNTDPCMMLNGAPSAPQHPLNGNYFQSDQDNNTNHYFNNNQNKYNTLTTNPIK